MERESHEKFDALLPVPPSFIIGRQRSDDIIAAMVGTAGVTPIQIELMDETTGLN